MNVVGQRERPKDQVLPRESQILWAVSRDLLGASHRQHSSKCFDSSLDWELLIKRAFRNRLSASLISFCCKYQIEIPDQAKSVLLARRRDDIFRGNLYRQEFRRIISDLQCITPDIMPFKGLVIAETLYAQPRLRVFGDLDLLIHPESATQIMRRLQELDFQPEPYLTPRQLRSEYKRFACVSFKHRLIPLQIDLHTHVTTPMLISPYLTREFFQNAIEIEIQGTKVQSLSPGDTLLVLALHGEKHQWQRLSWIVDMALALAVTDSKELSLALTRARHYQIEDTLLLGISLANELRDQSTLDFNHITSLEWSKLDLRKSNILRAFAFPTNSSVLPLNLRGIASLRPTNLKRIEYLLKRAFVPSLSDFRTIAILDVLFPLYYLIRPIRLSVKYLRRAFLHFMRTRPLERALSNLLNLIDRILYRLNIQNYRSQLFGEYYSRVNTEEKAIALTFDDGPLPPYTEELLEALKFHDVKATFFFIGENVLKYPDSVKQVHLAGHEIGNHSFSHPRLYLRNLRFIRNQIDATDQALRNIGIQGEIYFRAPYGRSLLGLPWILKRRGRKHILFDFYPAPSEWSGEAPERIAASVIEKARPGSIIVLHDGNLKAAPQVAFTTHLVISGLKQRGYRLLPVSKLLALHSKSGRRPLFNCDEAGMIGAPLKPQ